MELLTSLTIPILKGVVSTASGAFLLGVGGNYVHQKFIIRHPLVGYLINVSEKKFSMTSLVSYRKGEKGVYYFTLKIPSGYSVDDMLKMKPAIEDKFDCELQVWAEGTNFILEMGTNPIPKKVKFDPASIRDILQDYECAMYLGKTRQGDMVIDFTDNATPHLLFGGPTGGGKSNLINQGLCGMLETYDSNELNLYLIDLKDGVELNPYQDVDHVKGFYETPFEVDEGLHLILLELKRRNLLFKRKGVKKLSEYNEVSEEKLPRILIVADEFAQFNNIGDRDLKKDLFTKWEEILQKGRSTGIHVMIGTQVADADVFPKQIKGNIDARFGFKFTDVQHSKMISGGSELTLLPNIQGRGMFKLGTKMIQTQTPLISLKQFNSVLEKYRVEREEEIVEEEPVKKNGLKPLPAKAYQPTHKPAPVKTTSPPVLEMNHRIEELFMDEVTFLQTNTR